MADVLNESARDPQFGTPSPKGGDRHRPEAPECPMSRSPSGRSVSPKTNDPIIPIQVPFVLLDTDIPHWRFRLNLVSSNGLSYIFYREAGLTCPSPHC